MNAVFSKQINTWFLMETNKINKWTPNIGLLSIGHKKADPNEDDMIKNKTLILLWKAHSYMNSLAVWMTPLYICIFSSIVYVPFLYNSAWLFLLHTQYARLLNLLTALYLSCLYAVGCCSYTILIISHLSSKWNNIQYIITGHWQCTS